MSPIKQQAFSANIHNVNHIWQCVGDELDFHPLPFTYSPLPPALSQLSLFHQSKLYILINLKQLTSSNAIERYVGDWQKYLLFVVSFEMVLRSVFFSWMNVEENNLNCSNEQRGDCKSVDIFMCSVFFCNAACLGHYVQRHVSAYDRLFLYLRIELLAFESFGEAIKKFETYNEALQLA